MKHPLPVAFALIGATSIAFAACSGSAPIALPTRGAVASHGDTVRPATIYHNDPNNVVVTGSIVSFYSGGFILNGGNTGNIHITTSSTTKIDGPPLSTGENVEVDGTGNAYSSVTATRVAQQIFVPSGVISLAGPITTMISGGFTVKDARAGYIHVYTNASTVAFGPAPAVGEYAQAVGVGTTSTYETAGFLSVWTAAPSAITTRGRIAASTPYGFTLHVGTTYPSIPVALYSGTSTFAFPLSVGESATVTGPGANAQAIVASNVAVPTPTPSPTPSPTPYPTPNPGASPTVWTSPGAVIGQDDQYTPNDGDTASGGQGQTVDSIPCNATMSENAYHVHWYLGVLVNGAHIAMPDGEGMENPAPDGVWNGIPNWTNYATCFYYLHTHDASGIIHAESPSTAPLTSSVFTLGNLLDVWGQTISPMNFGPYNGAVQVYYGNVPLRTTFVNQYTQWTADPTTLPIYSHTVVWIEVGPNFVPPAYLPAVNFYQEY